LFQIEPSGIKAALSSGGGYVCVFLLAGKNSDGCGSGDNVLMRRKKLDGGVAGY
jgi:hypothetical protein